MAHRNRTDKSLIRTFALPAAAATANSTAIDLESEAPGVVLETIELEVSIPALPALADDKTLTVTIQDSADGTTFAAIESLADIVLEGSGGEGNSGKTRRYKLPGNTRRYIRVSAAVEAAGGNNTGVSVTVTPLF